ncbi:hypothetical protein AMATHDRAFT_51529 [Amanita thiersii Skay4041]|uniref:DUF6533 domain-containing protein n=1 Tax=Amanita thiersii Skay4041 TaxID=703135 RepID=A0A2A9N7V4_9AGAR|nr:hypothetical protein AMATHDRAFT_51529 [Amanita thiersii Skay4041]
MNTTAQQEALVSILETRKITSRQPSIWKLYDYLITLESEIRYVWRSQWSLVTVMYYLAKYLLFLDALGVVFQTFVSPSIVTVHCRAITIVGGVILFTGAHTAEGASRINELLFGSDPCNEGMGSVGKGYAAWDTLVHSIYGSDDQHRHLHRDVFQVSGIEVTDTASALHAQLTGCSVIHAKSGFLVAAWILAIVLDARNVMEEGSVSFNYPAHD